MALRRLSSVYCNIFRYISSATSSHDHLDLGKPFAKFLLTECGFKEPELRTQGKRFQHLNNTRKKLDIFRSSLNFLKQYGFTEEQIKKILTRCPSAISVNLAPKIQHLKNFGFKDGDIMQMVLENPRFLTCRFQDKLYSDAVNENGEKNSSSSLCYELLKKSGIQGENMKFLISRNPSILILSAETLIKKLEFVKGLGIPASSRTFLHAVEATLHFKMETLRQKLDIMKKLGFAEGEIKEMFAKNPFVIRTSCGKLQRSLEFLVQVVGYESIVKNPVLLNFSLEKHIVPRYRVVEYLKVADLSLKKLTMLNVFRVSEKEFLKRYVASSEHSEALLKIYHESCGSADAEAGKDSDKAQKDQRSWMWTIEDASFGGILNMFFRLPFFLQ